MALNHAGSLALLRTTLFSPPMGGTSLNALKLLSPAPYSKFWGFLSGVYVLRLRPLSS